MRRVSAFDLDHTLLTTNCAYSFGSYLSRQGHGSRWALVALLIAYGLMVLGLLSIAQINNLALQLIFKGKKRSDVERWVGEFFTTDQSFYPPALEALKSAQKAGNSTLILSSSPAVLVEAYGKYLGVDHIYATTYLTDDSGCYCGIDRIVLGKDKADYIIAYCKQQNIPLTNLKAYSDSHSDLPFLEVAGDPIAVNPDRRLRDVALSNRWRII